MAFSYYSPRKDVGPLLPDLRGIEYHSNLVEIIPVTPTQKSDLWTFCTSWWRPILSYFHKEDTSRILQLPNEILTLIAGELPPAPRASLALTCKTLYAVVCSQGRSQAFQGIAFPAEQPSDFQSPRMSDPKIYHPARWEFLNFLEKDMNGSWALCTECFTLHPKSMFAEYHRSVVPWLKDYYEKHSGDYRSCRQARKERVEPRIAFCPSGVVDLCPCIKLTVGKKRSIEALLRERARSLGKGHPAADFWWHQCQYTYGDVAIQTKIGIFLYDGTEDGRSHPEPVTHGTNTSIFSLPPLAGQLGILLDYHHIYPLSSTSSTPRLLCPHHNLQNAISSLLRCRETHPQLDTVCDLCRAFQLCQQCRTKIFSLRKIKDGSTGLGHCSYLVEKRLDNSIWPLQTVFPFARRQVPLQRDSPNPSPVYIQPARRRVDGTWT